MESNPTSEKPIRFVIPLSFAQRGLERLYPNLKITELVPIKTGFANSIFAFKKDGVAFILRMPPTITLSLVREAELMKSLFHEGIPVPQVLEYDSTYQNPLEHPFMIMEKVEGITLTDALENLDQRQTDNLLREITEALNRIHRVDTANLNVIEFITLQSFIDSKLEAIKHLATLSRSKIFNVLESWIQENHPGETTYNKAFIHNDFHQYNIMVSGESLLGILDWADAIVGEAQVDVALFRLLIEAVGYPELAKTFVTAYQQVSDLSLDELNFYVTVLAIQKFLQIPLQAKRMEETGQVEKAELMISLQSRLEKNFIKIIEENTNLSLSDLQ